MNNSCRPIRRGQRREEMITRVLHVEYKYVKGVCFIFGSLHVQFFKLIAGN